jgi:hypothetical protein
LIRPFVPYTQTLSALAATATITTAVLSADQTNNNAVANTMQDVTGLVFPVVAGNTYKFKFIVDYTAALTTTGSRWGINGPAAPIQFSVRSKYTLTATTETSNYVAGYDLPAASNATSLVAGNLAILEGIIKPSVDGLVQLRFASEVANSAIVAKAGSYVEYQQIN